MCARIIGRGGAALGISASCLIAAPAIEAADNEVQLKPTATYTIDRNLSGKKPDKPAKDLSGIACTAADTAGARLCMVVNDESSFAQLVTLHDRNMVAGDIVHLIGETPPPPPPVSGQAPVVACPNGTAVKPFEEFDGEGVSYQAAPPTSGRTGGTFYVAGSHGCSRTKAEFRLSSFLLARVDVDDHGHAATPELTYRVSGALQNAGSVGQFFGKSLDADAQGLNIEGVAITGDSLLFGLRSPSLNGDAFIVEAKIADLFAPGLTETPVEARVLPLALGQNAGIRDLAISPDGRLLVLSGPAQGQCDVPFALWLAGAPQAAPSPSALVKLGLLEAVFEDDQKKDEWRHCVAGDRSANDTRAKAEGLTVIGSDGNRLRLLVLFDGLLNGGSREYAVNLPGGR
jgi:Protein of unknown function (DUF3616)